MSDAALFERATEAYSKGDLEAAEKAFREILSHLPTHAASLNGLGAVACGLGRVEEGLALFGRAVDFDPEIAEYQANLARALMRADRLEEAAEMLARAAALDIGRWSLHRDLGALLARLRRHEEAAAAYGRAAALNSGDLATQRGLGAALSAIRRHAEAEAAWRNALVLQPKDAPSLNNLGTVLTALNRLREAAEVLREATVIDPDLAAAHYNLGLVLLLEGRLADALPEYEWRLVLKGAVPPVPGIPSWSGEPVEGRVVYVWAEQGVGDQIMFAGLLPDLLAAGARAIVQAEPRLLPILGRSFPAILFVPRGVDVTLAESDRPDFQVALGSLCRWLRPDLARFTARGGYLSADAALTQRLRARYRAHFPGRRLVGLSWRGGSRGPDVERSTALAQWADILRLAGFGFVSLQYVDAAAEIEPIAARPGVALLHDPAIDPLADLDALAAQTAAMDLVVSVDNSTAHMAGALGRPVWILLPFAPNWRWRAAGARSHWYPSARLFRQNGAGDWNAVLESVRAALIGAGPHAVAEVKETHRGDA